MMIRGDLMSGEDCAFSAEPYDEGSVLLNIELGQTLYAGELVGVELSGEAVLRLAQQLITAREEAS